MCIYGCIYAHIYIICVILFIPPATEGEGRVYWFEAVRPSVRPSVRRQVFVSAITFELLYRILQNFMGALNYIQR